MKDDRTLDTSLCHVSLCDEQQDTSVIVSIGGGAENVIVELEDYNTSLLINQPVEINPGDIIGYINGIKVKSPAHIQVTETHRTHFMGKYIESEAVDTDAMSTMRDSDMDEVSELLKTNSNVINFIKDFVLKCQFPALAAYTKEHVDGNAIPVASSLLIKTYENKADKIISDYESDVKKTCKKDHIKTYAEANDLDHIKNELIQHRITAFNRIISQYNDLGVNNLCSKGNIGDFILYDKYVEYLSSDAFVYDDDNPYVVELFAFMNEHVGIRRRLETNNSTIAASIAEFNQMSIDALKPYWDASKQRDFYGELRSHFKYMYYADKTNDIKAEAGDEGRVTLYSKVLDHLKTITFYKEAEKITPETTTDETTGELVLKTNAAHDKRVDAAEKHLDVLKKIAVRFCQLRQMEVGANSDITFKQYIAEDDLNNVFTLKSVIGEAHFNAYSADDGNILGTLADILTTVPSPINAIADKVLKKYLGALKALADDESRGIRSICDRAIRWYIENYEDIDSGKIFDKFKAIPQPSPTTVYRNGERCDFYFYQHLDDDESARGEGGEGDTTYEYTSDSLMTQHSIGTLKYWQKYCAIATIVNCMTPVYWATGIITPTGPVSLPIIFIPMVVLSGRVITVIGLGVCGICPMPMILFANMGSINASMISPINLAVDSIKKGLSLALQKQTKAIEITIKPLIAAIDEQIDGYDNDIKEYHKTIEKLSKSIESDKNTMRALRKTCNEQYTTHKRKNGAAE